MTLSPNAMGALWMCASMAGFVINDALMKFASADVPLFQAIFMRGLVATALVFLLALISGALRELPRGRDARLVGWRMFAEIGATSLFLTALFNMALANATAIIQVTPLAVTLAAALFLGEPVGWRRWTAITIGFVGMILIVGPGNDGLNVYAFAAIGAVFFIVLRDMVTRGLSRATHSLLVTLATAISITAFAGVITLWQGWVPIDHAPHRYALYAAALFLLVGYYAGIQTMRVGEIGAVAPFRYTNLLWALVLGWAVFGEIPNWIALAGAAVIAIAGLYSLHREKVRSAG
ncbi:MAG: DMT family transporter [Paracoccaceae bacterium]